jgi:hypothetical protein
MTWGHVRQRGMPLSSDRRSDQCEDNFAVRASFLVTWDMNKGSRGTAIGRVNYGGWREVAGGESRTPRATSRRKILRRSSMV